MIFVVGFTSWREIKNIIQNRMLKVVLAQFLTIYNTFSTLCPVIPTHLKKLLGKFSCWNFDLFFFYFSNT